MDLRDGDETYDPNCKAHMGDLVIKASNSPREIYSTTWRFLLISVIQRSLHLLLKHLKKTWTDLTDLSIQGKGVFQLVDGRYNFREIVED